MDAPRLETARLLLRNFVAEDHADVLTMRGDSEVARYMDFPPEGEAEARAWLDGDCSPTGGAAPRPTPRARAAGAVP